MLYSKSIVRGNEDKLADDLFGCLVEPDEKLGWRILFEAEYCVLKSEWEEISRMVAAVSDKHDIPWVDWEQESLLDKMLYLSRFLRLVDDAARLIRNGDDAERFLDQFFILPMGLYLKGGSSGSGGVPIIVIRYLY